MSDKKIRDWITADCETDPFLYGRKVEPFIWCVYDGLKATVFHGDEATEKFINYCREYDGIIYAHNGGKFDWLMKDVLCSLNDGSDVMLINGRVAKAKLGKSELRDSFLCVPAPLSAFEKETFDYTVLERKVRHKHSDVIRKYIVSDCVNLHKLMSMFINKHGQALTLAGASLKVWEDEMGGEKRRYGPKHDSLFRPYYFGGRCEVFEYQNGIEKPWLIPDINSSYPSSMTEHHPVGKCYYKTTDYAKYGVGCGFWSVNAISNGALPIRLKDKSVCYPTDNVKRNYVCTGWELQAGLETNTLTIKDGVGLIPEEKETLRRYSERFSREKLIATEKGNKGERLIAKLFMNSMYGKFGSNPEKYKSYKIARDEPGHGEWLEAALLPDSTLWHKPANVRTYYDVALSASITGHARSVLWRAINKSRNVVYCDTDSMICTQTDVRIGKELGEWDIEARGSKLWIAGKKLYAMLLTDGTYKTASKGVIAKPADIAKAADGHTVTIKRDAPTFHMNGNQTFNVRRINKT